MLLRNSPSSAAAELTGVEGGYTPFAKLLHWLVVALLIAKYAIAWNMPHIGRNTVPDRIINLHFSFGALILFVVVLRVIWKWLVPEPTPLAGMPPWQIATARIVHYGLYVLLIAIPFLGWLNASFRGFDVSFFGLSQADRDARPAFELLRPARGSRR